MQIAFYNFFCNFISLSLRQFYGPVISDKNKGDQASSFE